jgi:glutathione S-transferase
MRILYHFPTSPFSRRTRLALSFKELDATLRDARERPELLEEARKRTPLKTVPVLVDGDRALGDSTAITHYLDCVYASAPRLWPTDPADAFAVFEVASLVDAALEALVAIGNRYYALHDHAAWSAVRTEQIERAQRALDALSDRATSFGRPTVARSGWSAADMWLFTATAWLEGLPERAKTFAIAAQLVSLGWKLPAGLSKWADQHRTRADVVALG